MTARRFKAIDETAKDGRVIIAKRGPNFARCWWTGDMWALDMGDPDIRHQTDFDPTHYSELDKSHSQDKVK